MAAVSVIIPCFNAERYVGETLYSVFTQTFQDYEVIVIDDGSTDASWQVIGEYGTRHANRLRAERTENRGASAARNLGTSLARGRHLQYLDADDMLAPEALETRLHAMEDGRADVAYSDWQRLVETGAGTFEPGEITCRTIEDVDPDPEIATFTTFWAPPAALLYRRELVDRIGGWNASLPVIQDARFLFDAAAASARFVHVPGVGAYYRVGAEASLSRRNAAAFVTDVFRNARQVEAIWSKNGSMVPGRRRALAHAYHYVAREMVSMDANLFRDAVRHLYEIDPQYEGRWAKVARLCLRALGTRGAAKVLGIGKALRHA